ncbi:MAG: peptidase domain-containing ABC transporter [Jaaginema sp. PMC 1079.18]|nr:peptidase domain-containing ABC transporter [Jaaginema sp. PMC 1080.18]MEC4852560.1 peptidase domain-containing ABC transporter [Jaaginema sp. PMC 1079.18]MEC4865434.1 peptidase domain-containing ABC transporter [Jaaginema sp. PMC 1078.18]
MTDNIETIKTFLAQTPPFDTLDSDAIATLASQMEVRSYGVGQELIVPQNLPPHITIAYQGKIRLLGYDPNTKLPIPLKLLEPGAILGWIGIMRGKACETAIASTEVITLTLPASQFQTLLREYPLIAQYFQQQAAISEVFEFVAQFAEKQPQDVPNLPEIARQAHESAIALTLPLGKIPREKLDPAYYWFVSRGEVKAIAPHKLGNYLYLPVNPVQLKAVGRTSLRLIGLPQTAFTASVPTPLTPKPHIQVLEPEVFLETPLKPETPPVKPIPSRYPFVRGRRGQLDSAMACFEMLGQYFNIPLRRDVIRRVLAEQIQRRGGLSLPVCASVAELIGLTIQILTVPASAVARLQTPAIIRWEDGIAILYEASEKGMIIGNPKEGIERYTPTEFTEHWDKTGQVLLLQPGKDTPKDRFGWQWFLPALFKYRKVLFQVLVASFFVQLFGLANPLIIQLIIDKVIVQGSFDTLDILGVFLLVVAVFEALLSSLRTYLFVDTTNRIDLTLGSQIIDHLFRLPLNYFERRPVGELASRVNELENIRSFLTGTALTAVLDAIFSVVYIIVMLIYSWQLTLIALISIPIFIILTLFFSPLIRQQLRTKAERNAQAQSYLVEVLSGIQTVKAQNIESRSRSSWQERYARYVSSGFKTVVTSTTATSASGFLNKFSALLVLWFGAGMVLNGHLTLGQLIAFRIISSYVTGPMLRLAQLWQNFQETSLSLERIADIIDTPQEDEKDRRNIPMPAIIGQVRYENVSFRFKTSGPLQLDNLNLEINPGQFVGVVGESGAGKSTLTKLLVRLYEANGGRIFVDNYDIEKVELYSLRQQIGVVPQDTLLFDGTIEENITLTNPDATTEEIIEAAKIAAAHDFIMNLSNGYNTRVGERGSALSGGQRQRIAIARAILQRPRMIIFDEATSALDYQTERQVCQNLAQAYQDTTVFFITHRLGTVKHADLIVVMDKGRIAEKGNHDELMSMRGRYYCLYQQQELAMV